MRTWFFSDVLLFLTEWSTFAQAYSYLSFGVGYCRDVDGQQSSLYRKTGTEATCKSQCDAEDVCEHYNYYNGVCHLYVPHGPSTPPAGWAYYPGSSKSMVKASSSDGNVGLCMKKLEASIFRQVGFTYETANMAVYSFAREAECIQQFLASGAPAVSFWPGKFGDWANNCFVRTNLNGREPNFEATSWTRQVCASGVEVEDGCFRIFTTNVDQGVARSNCQALSAAADLAWFDSASQSTTLNAQVTTRAYVGLEKINSQWKWLYSNEVATGANWAFGEPNDFLNLENCASLFYYDGTLADVSCSGSFLTTGYICREASTRGYGILANDNYCDNELGAETYANRGDLTTTLEQCQALCTSEIGCRYVSYYGSSGCTHWLCQINGSPTRCRLHSECITPKSTYYPPSVVYHQAWVLTLSGFGCSNGNDISIIAQDQPSAIDCGVRCLETAGCVGFSYAARSNCNDAEHTQGKCWLWNGSCTSAQNACYDTYTMHTLQASNLCPANYPICHADNDCTTVGASSPWSRADSVVTNSTGTADNYITGYDNLGSHCGGDFQASSHCPANYPVCHGNIYCTTAGAKENWKRAPSADTDPTSNNYNFILGYDNVAGRCAGDFQVSKWLVSAVGSGDSSCDWACRSAGMVCRAESQRAHNGDVDTEAGMNSVVAGLGVACTSFIGCTNCGGSTDVPRLSSRWSGSCIKRDPGLTDLAPFSCSSNHHSYPTAYRLCWCDAVSYSGYILHGNGYCQGGFLRADDPTADTQTCLNLCSIEPDCAYVAYNANTDKKCFRYSGVDCSASSLEMGDCGGFSCAYTTWQKATTTTTTTTVSTTTVATTTATTMKITTSAAITTTAATIGTTVSTTTTTPKKQSLLGEMIISVSSPETFVQETNVTAVLKKAIAALYEVVLVDWVHNVTVKYRVRRLLINNNSPSDGDVDVSWRIEIPPDADGEIVVEVLVNNFDSKSIAEVTETVNVMINSGVLGEAYDLNVTWKYTIPEEESDTSSVVESQTDDSNSAIIIVLVVVSVSIGTCALFATVYLRLSAQRKKRQNNGLLANFRKSQAELHKGQFSMEDLLFPPDVITPENGKQLRDFAKAMMDDVSCGLATKVFITYSDGQREADAKGYGPGSYYAAAIIKHLHDNGVSSFCELMFPERGFREDFVKMISARTRILIVLQTNALYYDRCSLREIYVAQQQGGIEMYPLRFESNLPSAEDSWPDIERSEVEEMVMVSEVTSRFCKLNSVPSPPYTVVDQPSVLDHFSTDLRLKIGEDASLGVAEAPLHPNVIGLNDVSSPSNPMRPADVEDGLQPEDSFIAEEKGSVISVQKDSVSSKYKSSTSSSSRRKDKDAKTTKYDAEKPMNSPRVGKARSEHKSDSHLLGRARSADPRSRSDRRGADDIRPKKAKSEDVTLSRRQDLSDPSPSSRRDGSKDRTVHKSASSQSSTRKKDKEKSSKKLDI